MIDYVLTPEFFIQIAAALIAAVIYVWIGRSYMEKPRKVKPEFLTSPVNIAITVITFLTPLLIGGMAYNEANGLTRGLPTLITCFMLLFISLAAAIWFHFSLLKKVSEQDHVLLDYPHKDKEFVSAIGLIYALVFFTFFFLGKYLMFDFKSERARTAESPNEVSILVKRPAIMPGLDREKVHDLWGRPESSDSSSDHEQYLTKEFKVNLEYNAENKLVQIKIEKP